MQISITGEEVLEEYKQQLANANHELLMQKIGMQKLQKELDEVTADRDNYRAAEAQRVREAAVARTAGELP
jgi:hypothetical protein